MSSDDILKINEYFKDFTVGEVDIMDLKRHNIYHQTESFAIINTLIIYFNLLRADLDINNFTQCGNAIHYFMEMANEILGNNSFESEYLLFTFLTEEPVESLGILLEKNNIVCHHVKLLGITKENAINIESY